MIKYLRKYKEGFSGINKNNYCISTAKEKINKSLFASVVKNEF